MRHLKSGLWTMLRRNFWINRSEKPNVSSRRSENPVFTAAFVKQDLKTVKRRRIKCSSSPRENRWAIL